MNTDEVRNAYDTVAATYHSRFAAELARKPFDRNWLDQFAAALSNPNRVVELGTGDGHIAAYLAGRNVAMTGIDLSPEMVAVARRAYPDLRFSVGDMLALPLPEPPPPPPPAFDDDDDCDC